jgi:aspartyl protease family protein
VDGDDFARLGYLGLMIVFIGGYLVVEFRSRMGQAARGFAAWGLIFVAMTAGYALWNDLEGKITPFQSTGDAGQIAIPRAQDGHYYLVLEIAGKPLEFMVDTGASNVVLSQRDARSLGLDPTSLNYLGSAQTANGRVRTARVTLDDVVLGSVRDANLTAYVNDGEMDISLLGMDYLGRFHIEIARDRMILTR